MLKIKLQPIMSDPKDWIYKPVENAEQFQTVDKEFIATDVHGTVQLAYIKLPKKAEKDIRKLRAIAQKLKYATTQRIAGYTTTSTIFGFTPPAEVRNKPYCSRTKLAEEHPAVNKFMTTFAEKYIMPMFEKHYKNNLKEHYEAIKGVKKEWLLSDKVPFTGGVINKSNQLNYHIDIQNLKGSINAMIYLTRDMTGGELVVPMFGVKVKPLDSHVLLFRNDLVHGVAPIQTKNKFGYRFSIVYYANARMDKCGTIKEELEKARSKRDKKLNF